MSTHAQNSAEPIVLYLNVEEIIDAAWGSDPQALPALSSKGNTVIPSGESYREVYREVYRAFVERFQCEATSQGAQLTPPRQVQVKGVEDEDLLREHWEPPVSSEGPFFDQVMARVRLPSRADIISRGSP